jgi:hypothetical protein
VYQLGSSITLRRMTAGVTVGWYPRPIIATPGLLRAALARSRAMTSGSDTASGRSSSAVLRMPAGTAAAISASSES